jgi:hypothetical protein
MISCPMVAKHCRSGLGFCGKNDIRGKGSMYGSLFWIEWLDRLDRVLTATRGDVAALARAVSPRGLEALERSKRQLSALTNDLRLLDRDVLAAAGVSIGVCERRGSRSCAHSRPSAGGNRRGIARQLL